MGGLEGVVVGEVLTDDELGVSEVPTNNEFTGFVGGGNADWLEGSGLTVGLLAAGGGVLSRVKLPPLSSKA